MPSLAINLEIGHDASLREKTTLEGFTHDWEVFVRGCNGADIRHYVDRVVFHLHETFEKPKRVVKEPPYSVRTSGYAGFNLPIQIYLKNNQEPRKIQFNYDLSLQPSGPPIHEVQKEKYTFHSVSEDFRNKLLKGGAVVVSASNSDNSSFHSAKSLEDKAQQMSSKPRFSGGTDQPKKYKTKPDEPRSDQFTDLFGTPITKTSKVTEAPKNKESSKPVIKPGDKEKGDRLSDKDKGKGKNFGKDKEREREKDKSRDKDKLSDSNSVEKKTKDEKKDKRDKKDKDYKKDKKDKRDRDKEKDREREKSPAVRPKSPSPKRSPKRAKSPSPVRTIVKEREAVSKEREPKESKDKEREKEKKPKKHKDRERHREKEKEKERERDKSLDYIKEYKNRDEKTIKDKEKDTSSINISGTLTESKKDKDREDSPTTKSEKKEKLKEKEIKEPEKRDERPSKEQEKERREEMPRHKHKKKDKERREKKDHKKEKEEKKPDKEKTSPISPSKDKEKGNTDNLFGVSPKSEPPLSPPPVEMEPEAQVPLLLNSEDESSIGSKPSTREPSPVSDIVPSSPFSSPNCESPIVDSTPEEIDPRTLFLNKRREKKKRKKERRREERKRKVEAETQVEIDVPPVKVEKKENGTTISDDEKKVSSTEDANRVHIDEDYMNELRELQLKIANLQDLQVVQDVVNLIAKNGPFEVSDHTIDFDLCLLDRETIRELQTFFTSLDC